MANEGITTPEVEKTEVSRGFWNTIRHYGRVLHSGLEKSSGTAVSYIVGAPLDAIDNAPRLWGGDSVSKRITGEEWQPIDGIQNWAAKKQTELEISRYGAPLQNEGAVDTAIEFVGGLLMPVGGVLKTGGVVTKTAAKGASMADDLAKAGAKATASTVDDAAKAGASWTSGMKDKVTAFTEARAPTFWINREKDIAKRLELLSERAVKGNKSAEKYIKLAVDEQRLAGEVSSTEMAAIRSSKIINPEIKAAMENIYARNGKGIISQITDTVGSYANYVVSHPFRTAGTIIAEPFKHYKITGAAIAAGTGYDYATTGGENAKALGAHITDATATSLYAGGQVVRMISPSLYEQAKERLPGVLEVTASATENVAGGLKATVEGVGERISEIIGAEKADAMKDDLSRAADKIHPAFVPGGVVVKDAVKAYQHRQDIQAIQGSLQSGETLPETFKGLADQKIKLAEKKVETFVLQTDIPQQTSSPQILARVEERTKSLKDKAKEKFEEVAETLQQKGADLTAGQDDGVRNPVDLVPGAKMFARVEERTKKLKEEANGTFGNMTDAARGKLKQEREKFEQDMREQKETMLARLHEKEADLERKFDEQKRALEEKSKQVIEIGKGHLEAGMLGGLTTVFSKAGGKIEEAIKPYTDMMGVDAASAMKVGLYALGGLVLGSLFDNRGGGLLLGLIVGIGMAAYATSQEKDHGAAPKPGERRLDGMLPAPSPS